MVGERFGMWVVVKEEVREKHSHTRKRRVKGCICKCACGVEKWIPTYSLENNKSKGCSTCRSGMRSHGLSDSALYHIWEAIKQRCTNPNSKPYKDYGGRGITVCDEWLNSPEVFVTWAETNGYEKGLQLDRKDNDGGYKPSNCRFITQSKNLLNKRVLQDSNTSGYRGVTEINNKTCQLYLASVGFEGMTYRLGRYSDPKVSALSRDLFCVKFNIPTPLNDRSLRVTEPFSEPTKQDVINWRKLTKEQLIELKEVIDEQLRKIS